MGPNYWIEKLNLQKHPEGGYFREMFRSDVHLPFKDFEEYEGTRALYTSIYYLLPGNECSRFHRLKSDELWHFYYGAPITLHLLESDQKYTKIKLGASLDSDASFQALVPAHCWFGATIDDYNGFALVGCMVIPGFNYRDFELAQRNELFLQYPQQHTIIEKLT